LPKVNKISRSALIVKKGKIMSNGKIQMSNQVPNQNVKREYYHFGISHWDFIWNLDLIALNKKMRHTVVQRYRERPFY
jgi:hypothetical protein